MKIPAHFGFYGIITNPRVGYEKMAALMVEHRVQFIQLRIKEAPRGDVLRVARLLRPIIGEGCLYIINDDPEIAAEVHADGVHLGQSDMSYAEARRILGEQAMIGLSTHNPSQTRNACAQQPDYIGLGPVFATPTKKNPDPAIGLSGMREMLSIASVPAVVLGGIDRSNVEGVLKNGARNISSVRLINQSQNPGEELKEMIATIRKYNAQ